MATEITTPYIFGRKLMSITKNYEIIVILHTPYRKDTSIYGETIITGKMKKTINEISAYEITKEFTNIEKVQELCKRIMEIGLYDHKYHNDIRGTFILKELKNKSVETSTIKKIISFCNKYGLPGKAQHFPCEPCEIPITDYVISIGTLGALPILPYILFTLHKPTPYVSVNDLSIFTKNIARKNFYFTKFDIYNWKLLIILIKEHLNSQNRTVKNPLFSIHDSRTKSLSDKKKIMFMGLLRNNLEKEIILSIRDFNPDNEVEDILKEKIIHNFNRIIANRDYILRHCEELHIYFHVSSPIHQGLKSLTPNQFLCINKEAIEMAFPEGLFKSSGKDNDPQLTQQDIFLPVELSQKMINSKNKLYKDIFEKCLHKKRIIDLCKTENCSPDINLLTTCLVKDFNKMINEGILYSVYEENKAYFDSIKSYSNKLCLIRKYSEIADIDDRMVKTVNRTILEYIFPNNICKAEHRFPYSNETNPREKDILLDIHSMSLYQAICDMWELNRIVYHYTALFSDEKRTDSQPLVLEKELKNMLRNSYQCPTSNTGNHKQISSFKEAIACILLHQLKSNIALLKFCRKCNSIFKVIKSDHYFCSSRCEDAFHVSSHRGK